VGLGSAAPDPHVILKLALGGGECVPDGDVGIFVRLFAAVMSDGQYLSGQREADMHLVLLSFVMVPVWRLHCYMAAGDTIVKPFEFVGSFPYRTFKRGRGFEIAVINFQRYLHAEFQY
jgi:hypothetical protein